jgi:cell division septum initiation protein DivIVA
MLVDRLEAVINSGTRMFGRVLIDEREALDVLDLMRTAIPDEIKQARRVNQDREKILAQAQTEANRLVTQAQERADRMMSEDNIRLMAEERAHEIVAQARREADDVREGADQYAMDMLDRLDAELRRVQANVHHAINAMQAQPSLAAQDDGEE